MTGAFHVDEVKRLEARIKQLEIGHDEWRTLARRAKEQTERLRVSADAWAETCRKAEDRIEAALALHKTRMGGPFCPECGQRVGKDGYCTSPTVKALKGGSDAE